MPFDARYLYDSKDRIIRIENKMPIDNNRIEIEYFQMEILEKSILMITIQKSPKL